MHTYYNILLIISFLMILFGGINSMNTNPDRLACMVACQMNPTLSLFQRIACYAKCESMFPINC